MRTCFLAMAFAMAASCAATAQTNEPFASGLYVAGGYEAWWPTYESEFNPVVPKMLNGFNADVGWRFNRYYAVEGGYYYAKGSSALNITMQGLSADAFGYLPFGAGSNFALYAEAGVSRLWATADVNVYGLKYSATASTLDPRVGAGLQYQIFKSLGIRAGALYQWTNIDGVHGAKIGTLSLVWRVW